MAALPQLSANLSDNTLSCVFNTLPAGLAVVDAQGLVLRVNAAWDRDPMQYPGPGRHYEAVCASLTQSPFMSRKTSAGIRRVLAGESSGFTQECRDERTHRWTELTALPLRTEGGGQLLVTLNDVTARKEAEEDQRRDRQLLQKVVENIPTSVQVKSVSDDLRIVLWNKAAESIFGLSRNQAIGSNVHDLWPSNTAAAMQAADIALIKGGGQQEFPDRAALTSAGTEIRTHVRKVPIYDEAGEPTHLLVIADDVTEKNRKEQEILSLNQELEERVRQRTGQLESANAELQAFAYSVAHDLRGPLTTINGFAHLVERSNGPEPEAAIRRKTNLARIRAAATHMDELTSGLLSLAQLGRTELQWETTDLSSLAHTVAGQLAESHPVSAVHVEIEDGMSASCDRVLLVQVFANLIGNAWKFSSRVANPRITIGTVQAADGEACFHVSDNGAGFDQNHASKLFGAFQRLHNESEFPGTGIGLATVHRIIARHGGRIWARSAPGQGARFSFTLGDAQTSS